MTNRRGPATSTRRDRDRTSRTTAPPRKLRARDGGEREPPIVVPTPRAARDEGVARHGPYEDAYEITHGYDAERTII